MLIIRKQGICIENGDIELCIVNIISRADGDGRRGGGVIVPSFMSVIFDFLFSLHVQPADFCLLQLYIWDEGFTFTMD